MIRRREIVICTGGGFVYLLCHALTFLCAGLLSFALPATSAVWAYVLQPLAALLLVNVLGPALGSSAISGSNELRHLLKAMMALPVMMVPLLVALALRNPHVVPVISAAVFGAHLPVLAWLWQHRLCTWVGGGLIVVVAILFYVTGKGAFHFAGLAAGAAMLVAAVAAYRHAAAVADRAVD